MARPAQKALIEISSEAGRKIGGIYTVIRSKAAHLHKKFGSNYLLIGFLDEKCAEEAKFEEPTGKLKEIFDELAREGVKCKYGTWLYGDGTRIIYVDAKDAGERIVEYVLDGKGVQKDKQLNHFKYLLWKHFGIDEIQVRQAQIMKETAEGKKSISFLANWLREVSKKS